jgi:hypothetical protein
MITTQQPPTWQQDVNFWLAVWDSIQCHRIAGRPVAAVEPTERHAYARLHQLMAMRP